MKLLALLPFLLSSSTTLAADVSTIFQFPNGTWLENLALTHNGSILTTLINTPELHIVHPSTRTSNLVTTFPNATGAVGIAELDCDVFAVAVGSLKPGNTPITGSFSIWRIDLRYNTISAERMVALHNISMVNGLAKLNDRTLLLADSWAGNIVALDTVTKEYAVAFEHPSLKANFSSPISPPLGANGLRVHTNGDIYYSNYVLGLLGRITLSPSSSHSLTSNSNSTFDVFANITGTDDLAVLKDGSVLIARPGADRVTHVGLDGQVKGEVEVNGPTSVVLGREWGVVWVVTSGLVGGVPREGGSIVRVEYGV